MAELDYQMALVLQHKFEQECEQARQPSDTRDTDFLIAQELQEQFRAEQEIEQASSNLAYKIKSDIPNTSKCLVDPSWEVVDPTPDVHVLFMSFNDKLFWRSLSVVSVSWSKRMTTCAGICSYEGKGGMCKITLSEPLLKLRPRKDLVETLLHEMIHAYLFVTNNNRDRNGHGSEFHRHMYRINKETGTNITVYHDFHDEVRLYKQHWWRCDGPCQKWKPYFGVVRRATNRAPGPNDSWWGNHSRNCGGNYIKVKEPEKQKKTPTSKKVLKGTTSKIISPSNSNTGIRKYFTSTKTNTNSQSTTNIRTYSTSTASISLTTENVIPSISCKIHGFADLKDACSSSVSFKAPKNGKNLSGSINFVKGAERNSSNTVAINKNPSTETKNSPKHEVSDSRMVQKAVFSGSGHKLTDSLDINSDHSGYNAVRNHWLKKYANISNKSAQTNIIGIKRSNANDGPQSKIPKLRDSSSSTHDTASQTVECPICKKHFTIDMINMHVDTCIKFSKEQNNNGDKECIICDKKVPLLEYELHVRICAANHFGDNDIEEIVDLKRCDICKKDASVDEFKSHECNCPICDKKVPQSEYDLHLGNCVSEQFSEDDSCDITELKKCDECTTNFRNHKCTNGTVDCLVCGTKILQSDLSDHLDVCLSLSNVFHTSTVPIEDCEDKNEDTYLVSKYNCPFCLKLIAENKMNDHVDACLKTEDDSNEIETEKSIFIDS